MITGTVDGNELDPAEGLRAKDYLFSPDNEAKKLVKSWIEHMGLTKLIRWDAPAIRELVSMTSESLRRSHELGQRDVTAQDQDDEKNMVHYIVYVNNNEPMRVRSSSAQAILDRIRTEAEGSEAVTIYPIPYRLSSSAREKLIKNPPQENNGMTFYYIQALTGFADGGRFKSGVEVYRTIVENDALKDIPRTLRERMATLVMHHRWHYYSPMGCQENDQDF